MSSTDIKSWESDYSDHISMEHSIIFTPKFKIGDKIYHITPDSDQGVILNISYSIRYKDIKYEVTFGRHNEDTVWFLEDELSFDKVF